MRPLNQIAREIRADWTKPYFGAVPYLEAMGMLNSINDSFYEDDANSIVRYFLSNANTWKGEKAREIKKELNAMLNTKLARLASNTKQERTMYDN